MRMAVEEPPRSHPRSPCAERPTLLCPRAGGSQKAGFPALGDLAERGTTLPTLQRVANDRPDRRLRAVVRRPHSTRGSSRATGALRSRTALARGELDYPDGPRPRASTWPSGDGAPEDMAPPGRRWLSPSSDRSGLLPPWGPLPCEWRSGHHPLDLAGQPAVSVNGTPTTPSAGPSRRCAADEPRRSCQHLKIVAARFGGMSLQTSLGVR